MISDVAPAGETLGQRVRGLRHAHGLSQEAVAARTGLTRHTIDRLEKDRGEADTRTLRQVSRLFGVPIGELFGESARHGGPPHEEFDAWLRSDARALDPSPREIEWLRSLPQPPGETLDPTFYTVVLQTYRAMGYKASAMAAGLETTRLRRGNQARKTSKK
jgi:transcriptional regulator with XRE-family HTH domain